MGSIRLSVYGVRLFWIENQRQIDNAGSLSKWSADMYIIYRNYDCAKISMTSAGISVSDTVEIGGGIFGREKKALGGSGEIPVSINPSIIFGVDDITGMIVGAEQSAEFSWYAVVLKCKDDIDHKLLLHE
jgi:hypothetical protein